MQITQATNRAELVRLLGMIEHTARNAREAAQWHDEHKINAARPSVILNPDPNQPTPQQVAAHLTDKTAAQEVQNIAAMLNLIERLTSLVIVQPQGTTNRLNGTLHITDDCD